MKEMNKGLKGERRRGRPTVNNKSGHQKEEKELSTQRGAWTSGPRDKHVQGPQGVWGPESLARPAGMQ